jgi:hypothetical protein
MRSLAEHEIEAALDRLKVGLDRYLWVQGRVRSCDVSVDEEFQRRFDAFYRVRRGSSWRAQYFLLMESAKQTGIDFPQALVQLNRRTGRIEASFASKLVATLNPATPIIDRFVLQSFDLKLPNWGSPERESKTICVYHAFCGAYETLLQGGNDGEIRRRFDQRPPGSEITELKKVDLVLWQTRG